MEEVEFKFFDLIKKHDYWYTMSEDRRVYDKGTQQRKSITLMLQTYPDLKWIWDRFCRAMDDHRPPLSLEELRRD